MNKQEMEKQGMEQEGMEQQEDITNGEERIFEGGPTENQVENWKQQHSDIYMTEFDSETYVWRTLNRLEYKKIMNIEGNNNEWFGEEQVVQACILWPENYGSDAIVNGKAGVPSVLSDQIMAKSGFVANTNAKKL